MARRNAKLAKAFADAARDEEEGDPNAQYMPSESLAQLRKSDLPPGCSELAQKLGQAYN